MIICDVLLPAMMATTMEHCLEENEGIMDLIIPEGINRGDTPRVPKAPRGGPEVDPRRVIQDIFPSLTPDNDIVHQFKTSSAAGG